MRVNFERLTWENYPSTNTPVNADNLNRLEEGVAGLYSDVAEIEEEFPDAPTTDGTYTLKATVSSGIPTYSWVEET